MKSYLTLSAVALFLVAFTQAGISQSNWNYTEFAYVSNQSGKLFSLEYGIHKNGYNGRVKWRITNQSNQTVYDVGISDKSYTLANGKVVKRLGERITSSLAPGQSKETMSDAVNSSENYGNWSDKNDNPVRYLQLATPMIKFAMEKNGTRIGWDQVGTVKMK